MYSFKIWVTSAFISPLIWGLIETFKNVTCYYDVLESLRSSIFLMAVLGTIQLILSIFTWVIFLLFIHFTIATKLNPQLRSLLIFVTGIFLTVATFYLLTFPIGFPENNSEGFALMLCNCFCIGAGTFIYKLD